MIAEIQQRFDDFIFCASVQRGGDPVFPVHVISGKKAGQAAERTDQQGIAFHIDDIDTRVGWQAELLGGDIHHKREPLAVAGMTKDGGGVVAVERIIRLDAVCIEDIARQFGAGHAITSIGWNRSISV